MVMKIAGLFVAYLFAFVVARYLGADTWGEFSLALSVATFGAILGTAGLDKGMIKLTAAGETKVQVSDLYRKSIFITVVISMLVSIIFYFSSSWLAASLFGKPGLTVSFKLVSLVILPLSVLMINASTLQGLKKISSYAFINYVAKNLFTLFFLMLFMMLISNSQVVVLAFIAGIYVITIMSMFWLMHEGVRLVRIQFPDNEKAGYRTLYNISFPLLIAGLLLFIKGWIDTIMVGIFLTEQDVGIYNIALKLSGLITIIYVAVSNIAAPKFAEAFAENNHLKLDNIVQYSTRIIFYVTLPLIILFVIFPEQILSVFGDEFRRGNIVLILLSVAGFTKIISGSVGYFLNMTDSQVAFLVITSVTALLGIILNYLLIPVYGINGAATATLIGLIFWNGSCVLFIKQKYQIKTYIRPFLRARNKSK